MNQVTLKSTLLSLSSALLLGITGCGSDSDDNNGTVAGIASAVSGIGIDGILVGSKVCIDVNKNNTCDANEPSSITRADGNFTIAATTATGPLLLIGGIDNSTGLPFTGTLKAPVGSSVVTPITSAIQSLVESGKSAQEAESDVKVALGLPDVDLTSFDPYNEVSENARAVLAKQTQLQVLVHAAAVTLAGANADTNTTATMGSVFDAIAKNFNGATGEVVLDAESVSTATKEAADKFYKNNQTARVAAKVVAQASAESSVRDADDAKDTITGGTIEDAAQNLDTAIAKANTSAEDELKLAAEAAKVNADTLAQFNAAALAQIEILQQAQKEKEAEIAVAKKAQADAEAALVQAQKDVQADVQDRATYEALLLAQAAVEKTAKEKAEADLAVALAQVAAAEKEKVIASKAAVLRQGEAAARAAQAEANTAQARQDAAEAAALAAADEEKTLEEAKAAADLAHADAAAVIAQAEVNANVQIANFFATQARQSFDEINALPPELAGSVSLARIARDTAIQAVLDANITIGIDNNISVSHNAREEAKLGAAKAASLLAVAQQLKAKEDSVTAAAVVLNAKRNRIATIIETIDSIDTNVTSVLASMNSLVNRSAISRNISAIYSIAKEFEAAQEFTVGLKSTHDAFEASVEAAEAQAQIIKAQLALAQIELKGNDEAAANAAKDKAEGAFILFNAQGTLADIKVSEIENVLVQARAVKFLGLKSSGDEFFAQGVIARDALKVVVDELTVKANAILELDTGNQIANTILLGIKSDDYYLISDFDDLESSQVSLQTATSLEEAARSFNSLIEAFDYLVAEDIDDAKYDLNRINSTLEELQTQPISGNGFNDHKAVGSWSVYNTGTGLLDSVFVVADNAHYFFADANSVDGGVELGTLSIIDNNITITEVEVLTNSINNLLNAVFVYDETADTLTIGSNTYVRNFDEASLAGSYIFEAPSSLITILTIGNNNEYMITDINLTSPAAESRIGSSADVLAFANRFEMGEYSAISRSPVASNVTFTIDQSRDFNKFAGWNDLNDEAEYTETVTIDISNYPTTIITMFDGNASFERIQPNGNFIVGRRSVGPVAPPSFSLESFIVGKTLYYINGNGTPAQVTYELNGTVNGLDISGPYDGGTYSVTGETVTILDAGDTTEFVYQGPSIDGKGQTFTINFNGDINVTTTTHYENEADREFILDNILAPPFSLPE